jgi:4-hydroxythreonine-4-phosphate dehydrogenase
MAARSISEPPIALTMGDPAGIAGEITAAAWSHARAAGGSFVALADPAWLGRHAPIRIVDRFEAQHFADALPVLPIPLPAPAIPGRPDPANAPAVIASIERAVALARAGEAAAVVTNPISKAVLQRAGFPHPGHTEFLAALCGASGAEVMMLACPSLRVVPVTIHLSLRTALDRLDTASILHAARTADASLRIDFGIPAPRLAVAGLNPHAGEEGRMGDDEARIIEPAIAALRAEGIDARGPFPPDTLFTDLARPTYDAAICMYHDQALIPIKTLDRAGGVNITLGLPIVRTSPDHGTAFGIAGQGIADPASLIAALAEARAIARRRSA